MQAPKNGFFYVLDRATGELLSANNYVPVTWASHIDMETGRPVENPEARYKDKTALVFPGPLGGHNWHPMSFSPLTQLVYIPAMEMSNFYVPLKEYEVQKGQWNLGVQPAEPDDVPKEVADELGLTQQQVAEDAPAALLSGHLLAWDPVEQKEVWRAQYDVPWSGGTLSTAGNLVFQGTPNGMFRAYRATDGELLWESYTGSGVIAAPVTFSVGDKQYVAIMSGWGGAFGVVGSRSARKAVESEGRVLVYAIGATGKEPERKERKPAQLTKIDHSSSEQQVGEGRTLFNRYCLVCHGYGATGGGVIADLRESAPRVFDNYDAIVLEGRRVERGMPQFDSVLDKDAVGLIRSYVLHRRDALRAELAAESADADR